MDILHSPFWMLLAKSVLTLIMIGVSAACIYVLIHSKRWEKELKVVEAECDFARDETMIQATIARAQMAEIRQKMEKKPDKAEMEVMTHLVKQAFPLITLIFKKETSLVKWGIAGAKLAKSAFDFFISKQKKSDKTEF